VASISRHTEDQQGQGNAIGNIGLAHAMLGHAAKAKHYFARSRSIFQKLGLTNMVQQVDQMIDAAGGSSR
jgi:hypothetical protein